MEKPAAKISRATSYIRLFRVRQYVKNLFIFLPLFFSLRIMDLHLLWQAALAFAIFSMTASAVYILNDLLDVEEDRKHPTKKNRPIASGAVSRQVAIPLIFFLLGAGIALSWALDRRMLYLIILYVMLNVLYGWKLKHISVLDIFIVASGFVIRIFVGGVVTETKITMWIVVMTFLLALFLALAKRRDDVLIFRNSEVKARKSIDGYNLVFIDSAMMVMSAVIIVAYIMYTISPEVIDRMKTDNLYVTTVFVIMGIMRYMQITFVEEGSGAPTEIILKDKLMQLSILGWLGAFAVLIYL